MEGQKLDEYITQMRDKRLRRRVFRTCAHIDRDFIDCEKMPVGEREWHRGYLYHWWALECEKRFPTRKQKHQELCALLEKYTDSLFDTKYIPYTQTQLSLKRKEQSKKYEEYVLLHKKAWDRVFVALAVAFCVGVFSSIYNNFGTRLLYWATFFQTLLNVIDVEDISTRFDAWKRENGVFYDGGAAAHVHSKSESKGVETVSQNVPCSPDTLPLNEGDYEEISQWVRPPQEPSDADVQEH